MSPEDVHKRCKRDMDTTSNEGTTQSCAYPSLTHIMYFIHLMHHTEVLTLKISQQANEILIRTHNEYNNMVIGFQGYQDVLCTLFSKARDHLYCICGLLHLLHQACIYILQIQPPLQYLIFDDAAAESIQNIVKVEKRNIDDYLTISPDIAETTVELMKFYVNTKKLLYGFPLITIPPSEQINIGPSISQHININEQDTETNNFASKIANNDNQSVLSTYTAFSTSSSSTCPFDGSTADAVITKILLYQGCTISSARVAQILRRPGVTSKKVKKNFTFMENSSLGKYIIEKQRKHGKPRAVFVKDDLPPDRESDKYRNMMVVLDALNVTAEEYTQHLENLSENSAIITNTNDFQSINEE
ncbi:unnamed protein product [Rotaria sp. Silwood2]|nr:unnamed protein product [Rotaria sp. Silwood2]CAF4044303.1 unnamed protein product [Rotaria sp. Silwood2]